MPYLLSVVCGVLLNVCISALHPLPALPLHLRRTCVGACTRAEKCYLTGMLPDTDGGFVGTLHVTLSSDGRFHVITAKAEWRLGEKSRMLSTTCLLQL